MIRIYRFINESRNSYLFWNKTIFGIGSHPILIFSINS
ncbi:hypothetical protein LEP1GSC106_0609 [Leptospira interrogans serovar Grippotyphosa str. UI 12764]|nr:hypothetical protein LEP1GSC106_0609 [Leptospira interrogans serovar Grippotyphosa str. UI 12764]